MRELLRRNIAALVPYSCARNDFKGTASVYLDANENWQQFIGEKDRNRYPDPLCVDLRREIERRMGLAFDRTVVGNGSDEVIDNLVRMFCEPGKDRVLLMPPTYGAYRVFCDINEVGVDAVPLRRDFQVDLPAVEAFLSRERAARKPDGGRLKLLFVCSPNNPTGNAVPLETVERIAESFDGITVVDEAYHDFTDIPSAVTLQERYPRLVVLRTLSKCWGLAGARIGILVADPAIARVMEGVKYPYNVSSPAQDAALRDLEDWKAVMEGKRMILSERKRLGALLAALPCVRKVYPSDANFFLVQVTDPDGIYRFLMEKGIIVRNRSRELYCEGCLRMTIGSPEEDDALVAALKEWRV